MSSDDYLEKIRTWISQTGMPLEMRVAQAFRAKGLEVQQSVYFTDPTVGRRRETDVVAGRSESVTSDGRAHCRLVVECKNTTDKTWVAYVNDKPSIDIDLFWPSAAARSWWDDSATQVALSGQLLGDLAPAIAFKVATAHTSQTSDREQSYDALSAVTSAARGLLADWAAAQSRFVTSWGPPQFLGVVVPVVVISGRLVTARLSAGGDVEVAEAQHVQATWPSADAAGNPGIVHIVCQAFLQEFTERSYASVFAAARSLAAYAREK